MAADAASVLTPTTEQQRVIEHELGGSTLVVAGAGSGKTETMANRVVWLVANGLAAPDEVLGLTFTRKAAGELLERIVGRLTRFLERVVSAAERGDLTTDQTQRVAELTTLLHDGLVQPDVSTYNSFAAGIVQEFGAASGVAATATVIDAATAWRLARETVIASSAPELASSELTLPKLVERIVDLDHAVSENLTTLDDVDRVIADFSRVAALPYNEKQAVSRTGKPYATLARALAGHSEMPLLTRLAREFADAKERRGLVEFSDQVRLAVTTFERSNDAVAVLRRRNPVVLLDEVQDTSVGQTRLLSYLYRGLSVMAVGDPHQSIYGWRGASADSLRAFHSDFSEPRNSGQAVTLSLSTSWRNPERVLEAANTIAAPLTAASPVHVERLRTPPHAGVGAIEWRYPETVDEEFAAVAEWMHDARAQFVNETGALPTAAVLFHTRRRMPAVAAALTEAGVPNRIIGVGGLLGTPEVTDLVSTLRCLWYAEAGSELIRILTGPRFGVGVADIAGLRRCAAWFSERDHSHQRLTEEDRMGAHGTATSTIPDFDRQFTLLDAIDEIARMSDLGHSSLAAISTEGRTRLRDAGRMLQRLRRSVGAGIPELLRATEQELRLDIELDANELTGSDGRAVTRANLDAFAELVAGFIAVDEHGTLASVLAWLERATRDDEPAEHVTEPQPGTVDLITVHGSKGLEWNLVAIPRLVEGEFPAPSKTGLGWLRPGQLPDELRGDASARPELAWRLATTQQDLHRAISGYTEGRGDDKEYIPGYTDHLAERHAEEQRRLAYVAVTRAASRLLVTGSFWAGHKDPRHPSPYLQELAEQELITGLPAVSEYDADPTDRDERTLTWPVDPLGRRGTAVRTAADQLRAELTRDTKGEIDPVVELLLAEKRRSRPRALSEQEDDGSGLAERITASTFHDFVEDPRKAERQRLRPLPQRPFRRTRIGNRFHEWVERRTTTEVGTALTLTGLEPGNSDPDREEFDTEAELAPLIENFERSRFAHRQPIAVEQEVTLPFAGRSLVCKLDAVYRVDDAERHSTKYEIVDWKSGRPPKNAAERQSRFFQLDLYRHAYSQWADVPLEHIEVSLFYVADGVELRGANPRDIAELERIWSNAAATLREGRVEHP